jgi:hypothetical protein
MARNLCRTDCYFCEGDVVLIEEEREIRESEAGVYFKEYVGMLVANAVCNDCNAKYLAWTLAPAGWSGSWGRNRIRSEAPAAFDLSFRSSFNDEPGEADLPDYQIIRTPTKRPWPYRCGKCGGKLLAAQDSWCWTCRERVTPEGSR